MFKNTQQTGNGGNFLNFIKYIYGKQKAHDSKVSNLSNQLNHYLLFIVSHP